MNRISLNVSNYYRFSKITRSCGNCHMSEIMSYVDFNIDLVDRIWFGNKTFLVRMEKRFGYRP